MHQHVKRSRLQDAEAEAGRFVYTLVDHWLAKLHDLLSSIAGTI